MFALKIEHRVTDNLFRAIVLKIEQIEGQEQPCLSVHAIAECSDIDVAIDLACKDITATHVYTYGQAPFIPENLSVRETAKAFAFIVEG